MKRFGSVLLAGLFLVPSVSRSSTVAPADCLGEFISGWDQLTLSAKEQRLARLSGKTLACLFSETESSPLLSMDFLVDPVHRLEHRVQRFIGKNSLPLFNRFEKHFFALGDETDFQIYGYNSSAIGHFLGSPGFFKVLWQVEEGASPRTLFDYRLDFRSLISKSDLAALQGACWRKAKNNDGNLIFGGGLIDRMHWVSDDVAIGETIALRGERESVRAYFALLRDPE